MILYLTGLNNLDPEQIEAARLDGAKGLRMLWYIILPQLKPATFIAIVVTVIGALRSFDMVSVMTSGGPWNSSTVLAYMMYEESIFNYRMGYGAAVAVVLFLIMDLYIFYFLAYPCISLESTDMLIFCLAGKFAVTISVMLTVYVIHTEANRRPYMIRYTNTYLLYYD